MPSSESAVDHEPIGGTKLDSDTRRNLIDTYRLRQRGGRVYWIDAHKRTTAMLVASRYKNKTETETNVWSGHYVAVWSRNSEVINDLGEAIPDQEVDAEIRTRGGL